MAPEDDDRLDLSALDPTRDALHFERLVKLVAEQAMANRRPADAGSLIVRWWRPTLALAASLALLAWAPSLLAGPSESSNAASDPAAKLLQWTRAGDPPSPAEVLASMGRTP